MPRGSRRAELTALVIGDKGASCDEACAKNGSECANLDEYDWLEFKPDTMPDG